MGITKEKYTRKKSPEKERKDHRRGNNEGAISQRKGDGRWQGEVIVGFDSKTGKKIKKYVYAKSREECLTKVQDLTYEVRKSTYFEPTKIRLGEWLDTWLNTFRKNKLKPTTYSSYETNIRVHLLPGLGNIMLKDITLQKAQEYLNEKYSEGLSNASVRKIYAILNSALNKAVISELIVKNPLKYVELSDIESKSVRIFTIEEQLIFQKAIEDSSFYELFMTSIFSGLRIGEVTALKWENVDLENGIIKVLFTSARVNAYNSLSSSKTTISLQTPKTKASIRPVPIPKLLQPQHEVQKLTDLPVNELLDIMSMRI